ncbi:6-bladed beta-propeller [Gemmatimonadota bacterium]
MGGVQTVAAVVDLQIGNVLGEGPESFGYIGGVLADSEGRILVVDYQANEVRVFDSLGVFQFAFGREGSGPEEFRGPCCLAFGPGGKLWVRDGGNHRYSAFAFGQTGVDAVSTLEMVHSDVNFMAPVTFTESGQLIDVGHRPSSSGGRSLVRFELPAIGQALDSTIVPSPDPNEIGEFSVTREGASGQSQYFFYQPFSPRHLVAHGPSGRWASGIGSTYSLRLHVGLATHTIEGETVPVPLSESERERAEQRIEADAARAGKRPGQLPYGVPAAKPPIWAAFFDSAGRLWVEKNVIDGSPRVADLWDEDGALVKRVEWPADISLEPPAWVGEDWGLGIRRDSLGVQYIARVRF